VLRYIWTVFAAAMLWLILAMLAVDRSTTYSPSAISWSVVAATSLAGFFLCVRGVLFRPPMTEKAARLKQQNRAAWVALGILVSLMLSGFGGFVADRYLRMGTLLLPGTSSEWTGIVVGTRQGGRKAGCQQWITIASGARQHEICVSPKSGPDIGPADLVNGERVRVMIKRNFLGTVAHGVVRASTAQ